MRFYIYIFYIYNILFEGNLRRDTVGYCTAVEYSIMSMLFVVFYLFLTKYFDPNINAAEPHPNISPAPKALIASI